MNRRLLFFVVAALFISQSAITTSARQSIFTNNKTNIVNILAIDVTGKWNVIASAEGAEIPVVFDLKQVDGAFTGKITSEYGGGDISNGKVEEDALTGLANVEIQGEGVQLKLQAKVEGNKITGTLSSDSTGSIPFSGTKAE